MIPLTCSACTHLPHADGCPELGCGCARVLESIASLARELVTQPYFDESPERTGYELRHALKLQLLHHAELRQRYPGGAI